MSRELFRASQRCCCLGGGSLRAKLSGRQGSRSTFQKNELFLSWRETLSNGRIGSGRRRSSRRGAATATCGTFQQEPTLMPTPQTQVRQAHEGGRAMPVDSWSMPHRRNSYAPACAAQCQIRCNLTPSRSGVQTRTVPGGPSQVLSHAAALSLGLECETLPRLRCVIVRAFLARNKLPPHPRPRSVVGPPPFFPFSRPCLPFHENPKLSRFPCDTCHVAKCFSLQEHQFSTELITFHLRRFMATTSKLSHAVTKQ